MKKIITLILVFLVCFSIGRITRICINRVVEDKLKTTNQQIEQLRGEVEELNK